MKVTKEMPILCSLPFLVLGVLHVVHATVAASSNGDPNCSLPGVEEVGRLGIMFLKRYHTAFVIQRDRRECLGGGGGIETLLAQGRDKTTKVGNLREMKLVLDAVGLALEPTFLQLASSCTFDEFEDWVEENGHNSRNKDVVDRVNYALQQKGPPEWQRQLINEIEAMDDVLSEEDLQFWAEYGYAIVPDAVPESSLQGAAQAIWDFMGGSPESEESWYTAELTSTRVPIFDDPYFWQNRGSKRIHKAYSQIWGTADLWMSTDQGSFNPPVTEKFQFNGPHLHWDASLQPPLPMSTQGLLYLVDVEENQGAFTLVPGFQHKIDDFLWEVAANGEHPMDRDLHALGSRKIGGKAGTFIIWDHRIPHGGSPNTSKNPRLVQYMNMLPFNICDFQKESLRNKQSCNAHGQCSVGECSS